MSEKWDIPPFEEWGKSGGGEEQKDEQEDPETRNEDRVFTLTDEGKKEMIVTLGGEEIEDIDSFEYVNDQEFGKPAITPTPVHTGKLEGSFGFEGSIHSDSFQPVPPNHPMSSPRTVDITMNDGHSESITIDKPVSLRDQLEDRIEDPDMGVGIYGVLTDSHSSGIPEEQPEDVVETIVEAVEDGWGERLGEVQLAIECLENGYDMVNKDGVHVQDAESGFITKSRNGGNQWSDEKFIDRELLEKFSEPQKKKGEAREFYETMKEYYEP